MIWVDVLVSLKILLERSTKISVGKEPIEVNVDRLVSLLFYVSNNADICTIVRHH